MYIMLMLMYVVPVYVVYVGILYIRYTVKYIKRFPVHKSTRTRVPGYRSAAVTAGKSEKHDDAAPLRLVAEPRSHDGGIAAALVLAEG